MTDTNGLKHAVVLSGVGANGAYEVGVLKALFAGKVSTTNNQPLIPDIFTGTSVGAYNAAFLVAQWDMHGTASIANLEQLWLHNIADSVSTCGNGVYRFRGSPIDLFNPFCYYPNPLKPFNRLLQDSVALSWDTIQRVVNTVLAQDIPLLERATNLFNFSSFVSFDPFSELVRETLDFENILRSTRQWRIAATNWALGQVQFFANYNMTDQLGPEIIEASAAIPNFFPVQQIGSQPFVDGGVLLNTPLKPAVDAGADILHVIHLNPQVSNIPLSQINNTLATAYRQQVIAWVQAVEQNIYKVWETNRTLEIVNIALQALQRVQEQTPNTEMVRIALDSLQQLSDRFPDEEVPERLPTETLQRYLQRVVRYYRPLTVYLYCPVDPLGDALGLLNFTSKRIQELIERGFNDATNYRPTGATYVAPRPLGTHVIDPDGNELEGK